MKLSTIAALSVSAIVAVLAIDSVEFVQPGQVAVPVTFGSASTETLQEGMHIVAPLVTSLKSVNIQQIKSEVKADALSKDTQSLPDTTIAITWSVRPEKATEIIRQYGSVEGIYNVAINSNVEEMLKATTAKYNATDLILKREEFQRDLQAGIRASLASLPIVVSDVNVTNFGFSPEYVAAINDKQVAAQRKAKAEADAATLIAEANGKAEAQRILQTTLTPQGLELKRLELQAQIQQAAIGKWNGQLSTYSGANGGQLPFVTTPAQ